MAVIIGGPLTDALAPELDVRQFGPLGTSDDSATFNAAHSELISQGGGTLRIPFNASGYAVQNLVWGDGTHSVRIRGLGAGGTRFPTEQIPIRLVNVAGSTNPIVTCFRGTDVERVGFDGNGTAPANGLFYAIVGLELRMRQLRFWNAAGTAVKLSGCDNVYIDDVGVDNCGSTTAPAVRIESYWSGTARTGCNTVMAKDLRIERSQNCALDIASGSTPSHTDFAEFLTFTQLHVEGPGDNGGTANVGPLIKIGSVRHVTFLGAEVYGGPGALIDYSAAETTDSTNVMGGVHLVGGVLLGGPPAFHTEPTHLVTLGGGNGGSGVGDGFTMDGVSLDYCSGGAVSIASTFGPNVQIGSNYPTSNVASMVDDGRSKLARVPYEPGLMGLNARARKLPTGTTMSVCAPGTVSNFTPALNALSAHRIPLDSKITVSSLSINVGTGSTGATCRIGLYADSNGVPKELLYDSGSLACAGSNVLVTATPGSPLTLYPGTYWLAVVFQTATSNATCVTVADQYPMTTAALALANTIAGWGIAGITGALPSPWSGGNGTATPVPRVAVTYS